MSEGVEGTRQATVKETCMDVCECFGSGCHYNVGAGALDRPTCPASPTAIATITEGNWYEYQ
jgi:hypothetical protein